jgi:hypothetical protein
MNRPKNIKEYLVRSIITRNHYRDEEITNLRKDAAELKVFKHDYVCALCNYVQGYNEGTQLHCDLCTIMCCVDCDDNTGYFEDTEQGLLCPICRADNECNVCVENPKPYECNVCDKTMCDTCSVERICTCGMINIYCSEPCATLFIKPDKCGVCEDPCCSHNEHLWQFYDHKPICKKCLSGGLV